MPIRTKEPERHALLIRKNRFPYLKSNFPDCSGIFFTGIMPNGKILDFY